MGCCYSCKHWVQSKEKEETGSCALVEGKIVIAWEKHSCYEPEFRSTEFYEEDYEVLHTAYLACWVKDCSFKEKCYRESDSYIV